MSYLYYAGLDLGQSSDFSALAILEEPVYAPLPVVRETADAPRMGWVSWHDMTPEQRQLHKQGLWYAWKQQAPSRPPLWLRQLYRYPLRTPYPDIVFDVKQRLNSAAALVVDGTGVGAAVVDLFALAALPCDMYPIVITGGTRVERNHVPKRDLIGAVQVLLHTDRLLVTEHSETTSIWAKEMQGYQMKLTASGHDTYNARSDSIHDDLVLAVALAAWKRDRTSGGE